MVPYSRRGLLRSGAVVGSLSIAGCYDPGGASCDETGRTKHDADASLASDASWPTYRYDTGNTGYNPDGAVPDQVSVRWRYTACSEVEAGAAVADGRVYVGGAILNGDSGRATAGEWHGYHRTPTVADGTRYVAEHDLTAFDTTSGSERWTFDPDGRAGGLSAPTVADGTVYVSGNLDTPVVYAIDADSGTERWRFEGQNGFRATPAVADGTIYAVDQYAGIHAIDAESGERSWHRTVSGGMDKPPVVADGIVYLQAENGVLALDAADGTEYWRRQVENLDGPVAVADDTVFAAGDSVVALAATDGTVLWDTGERGLDVTPTPPTVAGDTVIVGERAFARSDGSNRWRFRTRSLPFGDYTRAGVAIGPAAVDGLIFMATKASDLYVLGEAVEEETAVTTTD